MAYNYTVVEENNNIFFVVEKSTNHVIKTFKTSKEAKKLIKHLNSGGGFNGWTPNFFVKKFENSSF